jgi:hypothetical protein
MTIQVNSLQNLETMASGLLKFFLPKDRVFYTLFESASANLETLAKHLVQLVNSTNEQH